MGSSASRPRPQAPEQQPYPNYTNAGPPPGAQPYYGGGNFTGALRQGNYQNNGQYYGGYGGQTPVGPSPPGPRNYGAPPPANADKQLNQTATIRNAVNVKKATIAAAPVPGEPGKLAISFQFDASAPCMVTVLIAAREDATDGSRLTPAKQPAVAGTLYEKGLGLAYPKPGRPGAVIDLGQYSEAELLGVREGRFPVVIRLESVTDKGLSEGHSLSELAPGGPQRAWVQSQTTFAQLARGEAGGHAVRPLKQKIWHEGVSYELQEIYGIEHATAAAKEREGLAGGAGGAAGEPEEERACVICMVNVRDTTVLPCRHMCMCHECAHELRKQTSKCPICRNHVESLLHIRMMRGQAAALPHMGTSAPEPVMAAKA